MVSFSKSVPGAVSLSKDAGVVSLHKSMTYTVITHWGRKDRDLYLLVEYTDGHVEVVSCFGTMRNPRSFSTKTRDGLVVHVSGDNATSNSGGDAAQEVAKITLDPSIRCVVPVVYSAKNSGMGSFRSHKVTTCVLPGDFDDIPTTHVEGAVTITAKRASLNPCVYTFAPCVIDNSDPRAPKLNLAQQQYSRMNSELRPTVRNGIVTMDSGEENAEKPRPNH
ncbi:MAG: hypothetical protein PVI21_05585 [Candidatus Woesebacteria bacterium]